MTLRTPGRAHTAGDAGPCGPATGPERSRGGAAPRGAVGGGRGRACAGDRAGLRDAKWPGRLDWRCLADGAACCGRRAHNEAGAATLAEYLQEAVPADPAAGLRRVRDKDHAGMLRHLCPCSTLLVVTSATPRAADTGCVESHGADDRRRRRRGRRARFPWPRLDAAWASAPAISPWRARSSFLAPCLRFSKAAAGHGNLRIDDAPPRTCAVAGAGGPAGRLRRYAQQAGGQAIPGVDAARQDFIRRNGEFIWRLTATSRLTKTDTKDLADEVEIFTDRDLLLARANVTVTTPTQRISADSLEFNTKDEARHLPERVGQCPAAAGERRPAEKSAFAPRNRRSSSTGRPREDFGERKYRITTAASPRACSRSRAGKSRLARRC